MHRRMRRQLLAAAAWFAASRSAGAGSHLAPRNGAGASTTFALIGDTPYNPLEERLLARVLDDIDDEVEFVVHVGDLKSGWEPCSDALLAARRDLLAASRRPLVYLPGDNEWLDCTRAGAGGFDPLERLALLRDLFFRRAGAPTPPPGLQRQQGAPFDFPENQRWRAGPALFASLNLPGSNNGAGADAASAPQRQHALRAAANEAWLRECFAIAAAERRPAIVIAIHADPGFELDHAASWLPGAQRRVDGYRAFRQLLRELATGTSAQVLLLHGDSHRFRADQPLRDARGRTIENFHRVECFGSPFASAWVRISIDPQRDPPFTITTRRVEAPSR